MLPCFQNERNAFVKSMKVIWSCEFVADTKAAKKFRNLFLSTIVSHLHFILDTPDMVYWKDKLSGVDWEREKP